MDHLIEALIQGEWIHNGSVPVGKVFENAAFRVKGLVGRFNGEIPFGSGSGGNPGFADNHLALSQSTGLVGTNIPVTEIRAQTLHG